MDKILVKDVYNLHGNAAVRMNADIPLENAIGTLARNPSLRCVFLVDAQQRFTGIVTRVNLLRWALVNMTSGKGLHQIPVSEYYRIVDASKARDLATDNLNAVSVKENDTIQSALEKMLAAEEDIVAVLDNEGRVLGDLSLSEVLDWVFHSSR